MAQWKTTWQLKIINNIKGFGVFYFANGSKVLGYWSDNKKENYYIYINE